jgi:hypothetical protein
MKHALAVTLIYPAKYTGSLPWSPAQDNLNGLGLISHIA